MSCNLLHCSHSHDSVTRSHLFNTAMSTRKLFLLITALVGLVTSAFAQSSDATVSKVTGTASVTLPDGSVKPLAAGMKVPQGATITTGADGDVYLETHKGYVTSIKKNSSVGVAEISVANGKENTILDLKSGNLVAKLDPTKKAVNNYQVRTPKGVAAARGTVFTVSYMGGNYAIAVVNGMVTITPPATGGIEGFGVGVQVNAGQASAVLNGQTIPTAIPLNEAIGSAQFASAGQDIANLLSLAVATVAVAAENNIGGTTAAELRAVADAVIAAVPNAAPAIATLVQVSAPTQSQAIIDSTAANAPSQSGNVQTAIDNTPKNTGTNTPPAETPKSDTPKTDTKTETPPPPPVTTPQPIDPSTVSRSGE